MASTPNPRPTRRALLAGAALVAPASLLPAIAAAVENVTPAPALPEADAALVALGRRMAAADARSCRRSRRLEAVGRSLDTSYDPVIRAAVAEIHACIGEAGRLPASTPAGLLVKARIVRNEVTMGSTMCADGVAREPRGRPRAAGRGGRRLARFAGRPSRGYPGLVQ
jgi:hypothetical protein